MSQLDFSKIDFTIPESMLDPEYNINIQRLFKKRAKIYLEQTQKDSKNTYQEINYNLMSLKRSIIYFLVTEVIDNKRYRGKIIKSGNFPIRPLGNEYYFISQENLNINDIYSTFDNMYIHENFSDMPEIKDNVQDSTSNQSSLLNVSNENFQKPTISSINEYMKVLDLIKELYLLDADYLKKKLKKISSDIKMHKAIKDQVNSEQILKALSFYDEMRSNKKTVVTSKTRQSHNDSLIKSALYYNIDSSILQQWIGKRNGFKAKF